MTKRKKRILGIALLSITLLAYTGLRIGKRMDLNEAYKIGQPLDSLNRVVVYYNGGVSHVLDRNLTPDGYNLGLKYQCVEFVKRYYYEHYDHKMPDTYGHAKSFFAAHVKDGELNKDRNLTQYTNPSMSKPQIGDLLILDGSFFNRYGHVAIVSDVLESHIEIIQQNPGPFGPSRERYNLVWENEKWHINYKAVLGWLRKNA